MMKSPGLFAVVFLILFASPAYAYIGPGIGLGIIATILSLVGAVFLGLFGILYYPIKRALRKNKYNSDETADKKPLDSDAQFRDEEN